MTACDASGNSATDTLTVTCTAFAAPGGTVLVKEKSGCGLLGPEGLALLGILAALRGLARRRA